jgi:hypothetical protein
MRVRQLGDLAFSSPAGVTCSRRKTASRPRKKKARVSTASSLQTLWLFKKIMKARLWCGGLVGNYVGSSSRKACQPGQEENLIVLLIPTLVGILVFRWSRGGRLVRRHSLDLVGVLIGSTAAGTPVSLIMVPLLEGWPFPNCRRRCSLITRQLVVGLGY